MMSLGEAQQLKKTTDKIVENLNKIHALGFDPTELSEMAKASATAAACLEKLNNSDWSLDEVEDLASKAAQVLTALQELEDESHLTADEVDEIGKKAVEALAARRELEETL